ncbi:glycosyltransferase [Hymenobacter aerilatus]|uniref:Glycosyltransferase n=1 Tax=Hymenobacter aerilatus TaxID=2932251 RepID=A0A8T9SWV6_9BACT|nr:glycosyltransferase [Hymenobacter aerilatus]UOR05213.1 glycosyltransferase [Hymenobacter aerilatus]
MTTPRVLMLPKWYPHRYDDQDGDFVARHVAAIATHAHTAVVFATVARGPLPHLVVCEADVAAPTPIWRYYYRAQPTGFRFVDKVLKLLLYYWCVGCGYRKAVQYWGRQRPQLVHVHVLLRTGLFAWWLRVRYGIPYLITEHWTLYLPAKAARIGVLRKCLTRRVVARATALHTVSENLRQAMQTLGIGNSHVVVIPNVVDTQLFRPSPTPYPPQPARRLLHVAAFNESAKNLTGLLRVMARLKELRPEITLRVAGYGPDETHVLHAAQQLGLLNDTVQFIGKLPSKAIAHEMQQADCLVLFSNYENLPCVLIEAQASGLPAVATQVGGVPELLPADGRFGLLVPPGDEAALADTLLSALNNPTQFSRGLMRARAEALFSYAAVGQQFALLYRAILRA